MEIEKSAVSLLSGRWESNPRSKLGRLAIQKRFIRLGFDCCTVESTTYVKSLQRMALQDLHIAHPSLAEDENEISRESDQMESLQAQSTRSLLRSPEGVTRPESPR
jgi:hypothetical protein